MAIVAMIVCALCAATTQASTSVDSVVNTSAAEQPSPVAERPVASSWMMSAGRASVLDTYLAPVTYSGTHMRAEYERLQAMKSSPLRWIMQMSAGVDYGLLHNPAGNHTEHSLMCDFRWSAMRRWQNVLTSNLQLAVGAGAGMRGGVIYKPINSNNVVSVKINVSISATAMASYQMKWGRMPVTLRYQAVLPVVGVFFSPDYEETYYEIYVGNHGGLAHMGWWGNRFDMTNLLTADLHLGRTVLRIGYRNLIETSWICNLTTRVSSHAAVLGVGGEWLSVHPRQDCSQKTKIISAMY